MAEVDPTRGHVLHVEDDAAVAGSVALLLRRAGFEVDNAPDGEAALRRIVDEGLRPDVLIVDFALAGEMDGCDTAEAICRALGGPRPTIVLSGVLSDAALPWLPGAPLWPMPKTVCPEELVRAVELFCSLQRGRPARAAADHAR
ncbi:MAG: response regulator [Steroidobacteraceae bacterium]|jgi:DNA-binding response OmpR family regulator|nr:response regulator [Steroidobacteraceae bacterium]